MKRLLVLLFIVGVYFIYPENLIAQAVLVTLLVVPEAFILWNFIDVVMKRHLYPHKETGSILEKPLKPNTIEEMVDSEMMSLPFHEYQRFVAEIENSRIRMVADGEIMLKQEALLDQLSKELLTYKEVRIAGASNH